MDGGPCGEDDSSEEDTGNKQSETLPVGSEVSRTSNQLNPREESALKAGVTALLRFIEIDLCLRLGVKCGHKPAEPAGMSFVDCGRYFIDSHASVFKE